MKFYTDGSRVGKKETGFFIGWGALCIYGVLVQNSRIGGSNINAEMSHKRTIYNHNI
ncbi:MAG: hypothetical protein J6N21_14375 [Butyrivibrio sp.]|nr:hypothetical protein [Butyrivibrio sp.]